MISSLPRSQLPQMLWASQTCRTARYAPITIVVPTLFGTKPRELVRDQMRRLQPVQCCGTMTLGLNSLNA
jgi:hypothetical protein